MDATIRPTSPLCPHKYVILDKWLHDTDVDLAVMQETRRPDNTPFPTTQYHVYPTSADAGRGGMALLTHRRNVTSTHIHHADDTTIHASVQASNTTLYVIGGHAPHTPTTSQRRQLGRSALTRRGVQYNSQHLPIICLIDANTNPAPTTQLPGTSFTTQRASPRH